MERDSEKSNKRKEAYSIQRNPHKAISEIFNRNLTDQENVGIIYLKC